MPEVEKEKYVSPLALKGKGKAEKLAVKDLVRLKELQARVDTDAADPEEKRDGTVDESRAAQFAESMKAGDVFPPVKVVRQTDEKNAGRLVIWDGMHTHRGAELAKLKEIDCVVWDGTAAQALYMASTTANVEHDKSGRALSSKDKAHAVKMAAAAFIKADVPKKDWPSNRELAEEVMRGRVSRNLVNELDPFGRSGGSRHEESKAKKRNGGAAPHNNGTPAPGGPINPPPPAVEPPPPAKRDAVNGMPANFEVKSKTGESLAHYYEKSPAAALERYALENHKAKKDELEVVPVKADVPKPGSETNPAPKVGNVFDWASMEQHLGWISRAVPVIGETYGITKSAAYKEAEKDLEKLCRFLADTRKEFTKKK